MKKTTDQRITPLFLVLTLAFCVCLIVANLIEIKTVSLGPVTVTAGMIVFPISYIINDCVTEVYGLARARLMIWAGFAASLFVTLMLQAAIALPGSADWHSQEAMEAIYGSTPRIILASFIAFICGSMVNAYTMDRMKAAHGERRFSLRAILSTIYGESVDSVIFFPIAFAGMLPWSVIGTLIVVQALLKTLYELLVLPLTVRVVAYLKRVEGERSVVA